MSVTIVIPNSACRDGAFTFTGQGLNNSADVTWHCTSHQTLTADPKSLSAKDTSNCTSTDTGWNCTATLQETTDSRGNLDWSAETGLSGAKFSPPSRILTPGQDGMRVSISIPSADCPNSGSFTFIGPENKVVVPWSCEVGSNWSVEVKPGSFNVNKDCDGGSGSQVWVCTAVLNSGPKNPSALDWSASASGASGIYFNTSAGGTLTPGQTVQVKIAVPNTACTKNTTGSFSFSFSGPVNTVNVPWDCSSPPRITIDTDTFNANGNCSSGNGGWNCTTTVAPESGSQSDLPWSASSDVPGTTFYPSSGSVPSGQSMAVNIFLPRHGCPNRSFCFKGPTKNAPSHCPPAVAPTLPRPPHTCNPSHPPFSPPSHASTHN